MLLARSRTADGTVPVAAVEGRWFDLRPVTTSLDRDPLTPQAQQTVGAMIAAGRLPEIPALVEYAPPVERIGKIVCVGLNYVDHAAETRATPPPEPILFLKAPDTVIGANDQVLIPKASVKTDYEIELAVVIGTVAAYLASPRDALRHVAGYAISNDVSEREFQNERGGQWDKGKNCATFNPLGPWLRTADEVGDPQNLGLRLWVDGELRQDG